MLITCSKALDVSSALWQAHDHSTAVLSELGTLSCTATRLQPNLSRDWADHWGCNAVKDPLAAHMQQQQARKRPLTS